MHDAGVELDARTLPSPVAEENLADGGAVGRGPPAFQVSLCLERWKAISYTGDAEDILDPTASDLMLPSEPVVRHQTLTLILLLPSIVLNLVACVPDREENTGVDPGIERAPPDSTDGIVDVVAEDYAFLAPGRIPSGWTTFRMRNDGQEHHVLLLYRLPEEKTFEDYTKLTMPFERVLQALDEGEVDPDEAVQMLMSLLPEWSSAIQPMGGPGLVAEGMTAEASVYLEPGNYVMECYVRTQEGLLHSSLGMMRPLVVRADSSSAAPPDADARLTLSEGEFDVEAKLTPGDRTFAVHFGGSPPDVHLARITGGTDMARLANWMNLLQVDGMREPAPAEFLGGASGLPPGNTGFFTVTITPGRYAWVSAPVEGRKVMKEFVVR